MGIYLVSNRAFSQNRELSLLKERTKEGIYALEWFFQRWGVGVPCINPQNPALCAQVQRGGCGGALEGLFFTYSSRKEPKIVRIYYTKEG